MQKEKKGKGSNLKIEQERKKEQKHKSQPLLKLANEFGDVWCLFFEVPNGENEAFGCSNMFKFQANSIVGFGDWIKRIRDFERRSREIKVNFGETKVKFGKKKEKRV